MNVIILGASPKPHRYAYKAQQKLLAYGHQVLLVAKRGGTIDTIHCHTSLRDIDANTTIDTVTVYINATLVGEVIDDLIALRPKRVIFNPGTESSQHQQQLEQQGISVVNACSLIMLDQQQF